MSQDFREMVTNHHARLGRAITELEKLCESATSSEQDRLRGKVEGVRLARSYLEESMRWADRADE